MGNYVFSTKALIESLRADAADEDSVHDMGGNIIPAFVDKGTANVYDFARNEIPGATDRDRGYWRDVGTLDAYHESHMDLVSVHPIFNLYNDDWPILTYRRRCRRRSSSRAASARESMVGPGTIISGGTVERSVISNNVRIEGGSRRSRAR